MNEQSISIEFVRTPHVRDSAGNLSTLGASLRDEGQRYPVTLWKDGTLLSGFRRHRAALLLGSASIRAVFVDTIEDAAKRLLIDSQDDYLAVQMKWSEVCRLWEVLRRLDAPAAAARADEARRRGVELRRQTMSGQRRPGRVRGESEDYVLSMLAPAFGTSESTARRLWHLYALSVGITQGPQEKVEQAQIALKAIDAGESSISANYVRVVSGRAAITTQARRVPEQPASAPAKTQLTAWAKSLPQMEGLVAGLTELGPPHPELPWEEVDPVRTRLMGVRRDLEKMIRNMKETDPS